MTTSTHTTLTDEQIKATLRDYFRWEETLRHPEQFTVDNIIDNAINIVVFLDLPIKNAFNDMANKVMKEPINFRRRTFARQLFNLIKELRDEL